MRSRNFFNWVAILSTLNLTACTGTLSVSTDTTSSTSNNTPVVLSITSISPTAGNIAGNYTLTIVGTLFATGATVTIGGQSCSSPTVGSSTSLTCTAPSRSAGLVSVVLTSAGTSVTLSNSFTYTPTAPPTASSIAPTSGPVGTTTLVTITGSNFVATPSIKIGGTTCTSPSFVSATSLTCTAALRLVNQAFDVEVKNPDNQISTITSGFTYTGNQTIGMIKTGILSMKCAGCHPSSGGLDVSDDSSIRARVSSGSSGGSLFYQRISNDSMPQGGPALPQEEKDAIAQWINNGAN